MDPTLIAFAGGPRLRGAIGRRAKLGGTLRIGGAESATFRVKLSGAASS